MDVEEVAHLDIRPSRHGMHEAAGVMIGLDDAVDGSHGMRHAAAGMLSPAFVPDHPCADAGMVTRGFDEGLIFAIEILHGIFEVADGSAATSRRHVLPDDKAVMVAPVEPKVILQLDVFAHHVHAEVLHHLQVIDHRLVGWGREQSVGPPALVEGTIHIERLVVEEDAGVAVHHAARELPHAEVSAHLIRLLTSFVHRNVEVVEVGLVGAPKLGGGDGERERLVRTACLLGHGIFAVLYRQGDGAGR